MKGLEDCIPKMNPSASATGNKAGNTSDADDGHTASTTAKKNASCASDSNSGDKGDEESESVPPKGGDDSSDFASELS